MTRYVIYKRLSRDSKSGGNLGLDAQQASIDSFLQSQEDYEVLRTFEEIETGTGKRKRPKFNQAIQLCKQHDATLLIAKLDRLARNVHVVSGLMESKISFLALDIREASPLTIHILAAVAEAEAQTIATRIKAALDVLKARGVKLGPKHKKLTAKISLPYRQQWCAELRARATDFAHKMYPTIKFYKSQGLNNSAIARKLNERKDPTPSGKGEWNCEKVGRCLKRVENIEYFI